MSSAPSHNDKLCPECGAAISARATRCWLCDLKLAGVRAETSPEAARPGTTSPGSRRTGWQFGLASLMMAITLIAVCLGVLRIAPGLGILLAVIVTPAFVRTAVFTARRKAQGRAMDIVEKIAAFMGSLGVVITIGVAAGGAFSATCFAGVFGAVFIAENTSVSHNAGYTWIFIGFLAGAGIGIILAIYVAYLLIRRLWPRRD